MRGMRLADWRRRHSETCVRTYDSERETGAGALMVLKGRRHRRIPRLSLVLGGRRPPLPRSGVVVSMYVYPHSSPAVSLLLALDFAVSTSGVPESVELEQTRKRDRGTVFFNRSDTDDDGLDRLLARGSSQACSVPHHPGCNSCPEGGPVFAGGWRKLQGRRPFPCRRLLGAASDSLSKRSRPGFHH